MGDKGDVNGQNLREWFERGLQASSLEFNNMRVVEDVEYSKYAIGGHKAGSVVYSYDQLGERRAGMTVGSVINGTSFIIMFSSSADSFDTDLPTVKEMIDSVHLLKVGSS